MRARRKMGMMFASLWLASLTSGLWAGPQQSGGVAAGGSKFRVVRAVSGTKGEEQGGRYNILDPRTTFYVADDRQIIVYFEWEGPTGPHKFSGLWKNPEGKVTLISDFEYKADYKRFGGFWKLLVGDEMPPGLWTLEARIDGEQAGAHTVEIVAAARPEGAGTPTRMVLAPAKMYQHALASLVTIDKLTASGEKHSSGTGFVLGDDIIATSFQVIDGAAGLRITLPNGQQASADQVVAWNRLQDWALLKIPGGAPKLPRAATGSWAVGDRCYSIDVAGDGSRIIVDADILGQNATPKGGTRLNVSFFPNVRAMGSPLLNEYGEVIGVMGGAIVPGASALESVRYGYPVISGTGILRSSLAVPIDMVTLSAARPATLAQLAEQGIFIPLLTAHRNVLSGSLGRDITRKDGFTRLVGEQYEYTKRDPQLYVYMGWDPQEKRSSVVTLRVFDLENRKIGESEPLKLNLRIGQPKFVDWKLSIAALPPGMYRLDVYLDSDPAWRTFFKISE